MKPSWLGARLSLRVIWELCLYDLVNSVLGFRAVHWLTARRSRCRRIPAPELEAVVPRIVSAASAFYWKPVLCLQRSVVAAKVLRKHGVDAEVVIGCHAAPFAGHAWVEVAGRVINDSPGYQRKMCILERF